MPFSIESSESSFSTDRLYCRPWRIEDAPAALAIYTDPLVTQFMPQAALKNLEESQIRINKIIDRDSKWAQFVGTYATFLRNSDQLIGNMLIKPLTLNDGSFAQQYEVGWHLASRFWRMGYATEGGTALLHIGFEQLGFDELFAVCKAENENSSGVMRRIGMIAKGITEKYYSERLEIYSLDRHAWKNLRQNDTVQ